MSAPKQNQNAQKWTRAKILSQLHKIEKAATHPENLFIGRQLQRLGLRTGAWAYWKKISAGDGELLEYMDLIQQCYEVNLFTAACKGDVSPRVAILSLRNAHGWRNQPQAEEPVMRVVHSGPGQEEERQELIINS